MKRIKFSERLKITFEKTTAQSKTTKTAYFKSQIKIITNKDEILELLKQTQEKILNRISAWISESTGRVISSVDNHYLNFVKYKPITGNSYINLPPELRNPAKGLINIKNEDDRCILWCHVRYLNPQEKDNQRIKKSDTEIAKNLDNKNINFPVEAKDFNKIEKQNNIRVNLFGYENKQKFPIHISEEKFEKEFNLLLITNEETKHCALIKDINKFMYDQTKHKDKTHFCMHCLQCFSSIDVLVNHKTNCISLNRKQAIQMPEERSNVRFQNYHKQLPAPFVIYADFESILETVQGCKQDIKSSYTYEYQKHRDCSFGYKLVCCYDNKYSKPTKIYRGKNAIYKLLVNMLEEVKYCKKKKKDY